MTQRRTILSIVLFTFLFTTLPFQSWAKDVYLNGIQITGMKNRTFNNVSVRLGPNGNIHITGKQYKVVKQTAQGYRPAKRTPSYRGYQPVRAKPQPTNKKHQPIQLRLQPTAKKFNKNYIMVFQRSAKEGSGYRIVITLNGKKIRTIPLSTGQDVVMLNKYLHKGLNSLVIEAIKIKQTYGSHLSIIFSTGRIKGGRVFINRPYILKYKRLSTDKTSFQHIFPIRIK